MHTQLSTRTTCASHPLHATTSTPRRRCCTHAQAAMPHSATPFRSHVAAHGHAAGMGTHRACASRMWSATACTSACSAADAGSAVPTTMACGARSMTLSRSRSMSLRLRGSLKGPSAPGRGLRGSAGRPGGTRVRKGGPGAWAGAQCARDSWAMQCRAACPVQSCAPVRGPHLCARPLSCPHISRSTRLPCSLSATTTCAHTSACGMLAQHHRATGGALGRSWHGAHARTRTPCPHTPTPARAHRG